jgi:hypothetical protein
MNTIISIPEFMSNNGNQDKYYISEHYPSSSSPPTSAEVKKMWIYTSTPPYAFMA